MKLFDNERGITLTVLIITIIVLLILASTATYTGVEVMQNSAFTVFNEEMKILQTEVNSAHEKIEIDEEDNKKINNKLISSIGKDIPNNSNIETMKNNMRTQWQTTVDLTDYRYFDSDDLKNDLNIEEIKRVTPVLINLQTASVISVAGVQKEGKTYYKLEQLPDNVNKIDYEEIQTSPPTFNVTSETTSSYMKIILNNIQINSQYVKKYKILYQAEGNSTWTTVAEDLITDSYAFDVKVGGTYNIKIVDAKNQESAVQTVTVKYNKTIFSLNVEKQNVNNVKKIIISGTSSNTNIDQIIITDSNNEITYIANDSLSTQINKEFTPTVQGNYVIKVEDEYGNFSEEKSIEFIQNNEIIQEFEMPILTANDCMIDGKRYIVTASSELDSPRVAYKVFDGSLNDEAGCWHSSGSAPQWLQIQFQNAVEVRTFSIQNRETDTETNISYCAKDFTLQASNDNLTWDNLGEYTIVRGSGQKTTFEILSPNYYKYYKFNITSSFDPDYISIGEITFDDAEEKVEE